jgi:hypothetical protein
MKKKNLYNFLEHGIVSYSYQKRSVVPHFTEAEKELQIQKTEDLLYL